MERILWLPNTRDGKVREYFSVSESMGELIVSNELLQFFSWCWQIQWDSCHLTGGGIKCRAFANLRTGNRKRWMF